MTRLSVEEVQRFEREGYLLIPQLFSDTEIQAIKDTILRLKENPQIIHLVRNAVVFRGSLFNYTTLETIVFDDRILDVARSVLGDSLLYFGDSSFQTGQGPRGLHRDNIDRLNPLGPDWDGDYPLLRMGIYIGDFVSNSGGLKLVPRSHRSLLPFLPRPLRNLLNRAVRPLTPLFTVGRKLQAVVQGGHNIPSRSGDLMIWSFRLLHSGNAVKLRKHLDWALPTWLEDHLPESWRAQGNKDRMVLFCAFARAGSSLNRYLAGRRPADLNQWRWTRWDPSFEAMARSKRVDLQKADPEMGALYRGTEPGEV